MYIYYSFFNIVDFKKDAFWNTFRSFQKAMNLVKSDLLKHG